MRPTPKKLTSKKPAPRKSAAGPRTDAGRTLVRMRKYVTDALAEVKTARGYMKNEWMGPQHEALEWAESMLEKAVKL